MKLLVVIALCLFSMLSVQSMHAYANSNTDVCKLGGDEKVIDPEMAKNCKGVTDGTENDILYELTRANVIFFLISCVLFGVGIVLSKRKKEPTKKERILIETLCWLPFVLNFFFIIINIFQILM